MSLGINGGRAWHRRGRGNRAIVMMAALAAAVFIFVGRVIVSDEDGAADGSRTYQTAVGEIRTVPLPDGTRVTLGPRSRLDVARRFGRDHRTVTLSGQATFIARPDVARLPFIVRTGVVSTRVLGTTFSVRREALHAPVRISVANGRVDVRALGVHTTVPRGSAVSVTDSAVSPLAPDAVAADTLWQRGRLVFDGTPAPEMLAVLGRWYGYDFRLSSSALADRLAAIHVKAEFHAGVPAETLVLLRNVLDVRIAVDGRVVTLSPAQGDTNSPARSRRALPLPPTEVGK